ncbi:MAG TPA: hypothetical protein VGW40_13875 [Allosphingosinicella sp.]|nr:hypothetical protein [Allosphingosinicella sp.]
MAGRSLALVALALTLPAADALAADPPAPAGEQRLICRGGERRLGTRTRTPRRCLTAEQWQREAENDQAGLPVTLQVTQGQNDGRVVPTPQ